MFPSKKERISLCLPVYYKRGGMICKDTAYAEGLHAPVSFAVRLLRDSGLRPFLRSLDSPLPSSPYPIPRRLEGSYCPVVGRCVGISSSRAVPTVRCYGWCCVWQPYGNRVWGQTVGERPHPGSPPHCLATSAESGKYRYRRVPPLRRQPDASA